MCTGSDFRGNKVVLPARFRYNKTNMDKAPENVPDEEMIEIVSTLIEKLQQIEDKYFYALEFDDYMQEMEDYDDVD